MSDDTTTPDPSGHLPNPATHDGTTVAQVRPGGPWYVCRTLRQYLHMDGRWRPTPEPDGWYETEADARAVLAADRYIPPGGEGDDAELRRDPNAAWADRATPWSAGQAMMFTEWLTEQTRPRADAAFVGGSLWQAASALESAGVLLDADKIQDALAAERATVARLTAERDAARREADAMRERLRWRDPVAEPPLAGVDVQVMRSSGSRAVARLKRGHTDALWVFDGYETSNSYGQILSWCPLPDPPTEVPDAT